MSEQPTQTEQTEDDDLDLSPEPFDDVLEPDNPDDVAEDEGVDLSERPDFGDEGDDA